MAVGFQRVTHRTPIEPAYGAAHRGLALLTGVSSLAAFVGAIGLATGGVALSEEATARLPLASPVLAAIALLLVVAIPLAFVTHFAWDGHYATAPSAGLCGLFLVGWIIVQMLLTREFSLLQPLYATLGLWLMMWGFVNRP